MRHAHRRSLASGRRPATAPPPRLAPREGQLGQLMRSFDRSLRALTTRPRRETTTSWESARWSITSPNTGYPTRRATSPTNTSRCFSRTCRDHMPATVLTRSQRSASFGTSSRKKARSASPRCEICDRRRFPRRQWRCSASSSSKHSSSRKRSGFHHASRHRDTPTVHGFRNATAGRWPGSELRTLTSIRMLLTSSAKAQDRASVLRRAHRASDRPLSPRTQRQPDAALPGFGSARRAAYRTRAFCKWFAAPVNSPGSAGFTLIN